MKKEITFDWLQDQWKPLIQKTLSQNNILGLEREDLEQELLLVLWECFAKNNVQYFPTYLSRAIHNKVVDLYSGSQRFYYPPDRVRCKSCDFATVVPLKKCPECNKTRWRVVKGPLIESVFEEIPYYDRGLEESYPEDIEKILSGRKIGYKQKQILRDYYEWNK